MSINRNDLVALRTGQKQAQRSGEYWSKEDQEKLIELFMEGRGISELSLLFGRTEVSIFQQISKTGLWAMQCRSRNRQGKSPNNIRCLCPDCAMTDCKNCGKECAHAGNV